MTNLLEARKLGARGLLAGSVPVWALVGAVVTAAEQKASDTLRAGKNPHLATRRRSKPD
jgi:hypothetical protein